MKILSKASWALAALIAASLMAPAFIPALAETWPNRPVRLIVTLGPGSGVDIGARLFADKLAQRWGQSVVVENRPGGFRPPPIDPNAAPTCRRIAARRYRRRCRAPTSRLGAPAGSARSRLKLV